jgi:two-component SAPR family response regulator
LERLVDLAAKLGVGLGKRLAEVWQGVQDGAGVLKVEDDALALLQVDQLLASTDADTEPDLEAALALWRGEPLEGADYIWADAHIHRLRATLLGLLERAGHARLERDDARGALQMAEQAIALDQFHEASWRLALQAEHALGMRKSITRRYDDLARALDEQLGLQPTRETRAMYRQLLGQS